MKTARFERAWLWPMNSVSRCGRNEVSAVSSSRRSDVTSLVVAPAVELKSPSQCALPAVLVRQQVADRRDGRTVRRGHDDAGFAVVVPNELAATPAGRHDGNGPVGLLRLGMAHRHDGLDPGLARFGQRAPERDRLGTYCHATEIRIEIDAGVNASIARAQRRADFLPIVLVALRDGLHRGGDELLVTVT